MKRKLASLQLVLDVKEHPNADNLRRPSELPQFPDSDRKNRLKVLKAQFLSWQIPPDNQT